MYTLTADAVTPNPSLNDTGPTPVAKMVICSPDAAGFLNLFSTGPVPPLAGQFFGTLVQSHYIAVVMAIQIIGGLALLFNRRTPLALTVLGPVIFNILLFHITMAPAGLPPALFVTVLWSIVAYSVRPAFAGLFANGSVQESKSQRAGQGLAQHA